MGGGRCRRGGDGVWVEGEVVGAVDCSEVK